MKKSILFLNKKQSKISQVLFVVLFLFTFFFLDDFLGDLLWYIDIVVNFSIIFLIYYLIDFGTEVRIQNSSLMTGKYHRLSGFFKANIQIPLNEISEIGICQSTDKYFQITAFSAVQTIVIKELPNKIPAQLELEK